MCSSPAWPFSISFFFLLLTFSPSHAAQKPFAQGNLAVIFQPRSGRNSEHSAQMANLSSLWCQATANGHDRLPIKSARFVHLQPLPVEVLQARLSPSGHRAFLDFGQVPISAIGKYRCEITTEDEQPIPISGNLFVYMRPVLSVNASMRLDAAEEDNAFAWVGAAHKVYNGEDAVMHCPVVGYPTPRLRWFKDGQPINLSHVVSDDDGIARRMKYILDGTRLHIHRVCAMDEGIYKCIAHNQFPPEVDAKPEQYELSLEQHLRVTSPLSWLFPLLVIIACLLLVALIIYGCSAWKKHKYRQYNVAQKERHLKDNNTDPEQQKQLPAQQEGEADD